MLLTGTHESVSGVKRPRGVRPLTVHQVVNFGAGRGMTFWAIYSTAEARKHRRYAEAVAALAPCVCASIPADVQLVTQGATPTDPGAGSPEPVAEHASTA